MNEMNTTEELRRAFEVPSADLEGERLVLEATELILAEMERQGFSRTDLARSLGKTKGHVSQILSGERNMTLRTLAEIALALSFRMQLDAEPIAVHSRVRGEIPACVLEAIGTDIEPSAASFRRNLTAEFRELHRDEATVVSMAQWLHNRRRPIWASTVTRLEHDVRNDD